MTECILITGGAGFIGCELSHRLGGRGLPVVAFDNLHPQVHATRTRPACGTRSSASSRTCGS